MDTATRTVLANLAGSFLIVLAFVALAAAAVALYMIWRGAGAVRPEARRIAGEIERRTFRAEGVTKDTARAVIEPQVRILSRWVGFKTTVRALVGRDDRGSLPPSA